jgi:hypothetical protein
MKMGPNLTEIRRKTVLRFDNIRPLSVSCAATLDTYDVWQDLRQVNRLTAGGSS